ncbi:hypothetical protein OKW41_003182 [Paraburkholderia sp. UCT70]|uniref:hypothetical protein n=1 Tax=Paraburkholderia sp. UCT70 TaxID=2991068 RepID=UPI003D20BBB6
MNDGNGSAHAFCIARTPETIVALVRRALVGQLLTFSRIERWTFKWPIHLDSGRSQNGLLRRALAWPHASRDAVALPGFLALALARDAADRISSSSDSQRLQYRKMYFSEAIRFRN